MLEKINYGVFTLEEKIYIKRMIKLGDYKNLTIPIAMNKAKENEIEKIRKDLEPLTADFESKVRKEYDKKHQDGPQTPEEEAKLEKALRLEYEEYSAKLLKKKEKRIKRPEKVKISNKFKKKI